jgi:Calcium-activated chloride channel
MPIPLIRSFIFEGSNHRYTELGAIKNYFGEKVGFQYAWLSFYTVWLTLPAAAGIALTIFQIVKGVDTPLTTVYALFVCIWVTVFIERWKRKSAEICLKWGLSNMVFNQIENRVMRDEFNGYEAFSHETHETEKKTMRSWLLIVQLMTQVPIYLILIGLCIGSFILQ